jgi:hypothetical protein
MCGWFCATMTKGFKMKTFDSRRFQELNFFSFIRVVRFKFRVYDLR